MPLKDITNICECVDQCAQKCRSKVSLKSELQPNYKKAIKVSLSFYCLNIFEKLLYLTNIKNFSFILNNLEDYDYEKP
jgi:hypothetical protein